MINCPLPENCYTDVRRQFLGFCLRANLLALMLDGPYVGGEKLLHLNNLLIG